MDFSKIENIEFDGIDYKDAPDFCDAFISSADYNGIALSEDELDIVNKDSDFVHDKLYEHLY